MCLEAIDDADLAQLRLANQLVQHLLGDRLVRGERHALFDAVRVGVLAVPLLRLVALADRARRAARDALAVRRARRAVEGVADNDRLEERGHKVFLSEQRRRRNRPLLSSIRYDTGRWLRNDTPTYSVLSNNVGSGFRRRRCRGRHAPLAGLRPPRFYHVSIRQFLLADMGVCQHIPDGLAHAVKVGGVLFLFVLFLSEQLHVEYAFDVLT